MHKILMLYYPLLDPIMSNPDEVLEAYNRHGCHMIEVSLPYENPTLDGPVIRGSMKRIQEKHSIDDMFQAVSEVKERFPCIKIQLMAYIEMIEKAGYHRFADLCKNARVDYVLSPNASADQLANLDQIFEELYDIPVIRFLSYKNNEEMLERAKTGKCYLFLQSGNSKSGSCQEIGGELKDKIAYLRKNKIEIPIIIGFGIKRKEQIRECYQCGADGVTIGSELIDYIARSEINSFLNSLTVE